MPWLLQPKNYAQIARPNLYNVAYGRVGGYKGMGRLHPTNYLEIGPRPNRISNTVSQYNTLSGQLSLFPPSLRGLGQYPCSDNPALTCSVKGGSSTDPVLNPNADPVVFSAGDVASSWLQQNAVWVAIGVLGFAVLLGARR